MAEPEMNVFEAAGFNEEACEKMWKICYETGIEPESVICCIRYQEDVHLADKLFGHDCGGV